MEVRECGEIDGASRGSTRPGAARDRRFSGRADEHVDHARPSRPRIVLIFTVLTVTAVYVAFQAAIALALGGSAAASSSLPALRMAETRLGAAGGRWLAGVAALSMVGSVSEGLLVRPRIAFALARDGLAPAWLARVDTRGTPTAATLSHGVLVLALLATGSFGSLLLLLTLAQGAVGLLEAASWFRIARLRPAVVRCPGAPWVPAAFTAANAALCVAVAVASPASLLSAAAILGALAVAGVVTSLGAGSRA